MFGQKMAQVTLLNMVGINGIEYGDMQLLCEALSNHEEV